MSIRATLEKLTDPMNARKKEVELKNQLKPENQKSNDDGFKCRVCGFLSDNKTYCPQCLSDTMEKTQK
jgi:rubrerythrin